MSLKHKETLRLLKNEKQYIFYIIFIVVALVGLCSLQVIKSLISERDCVPERSSAGPTSKLICKGIKTTGKQER